MTKNIAEKVLQTLSLATEGANIDLEEQVDFIFILLGRLLHIEETKEVGSTIEAEIDGIIQKVYPAFTSASDEIIRAIALDILRYLPLNTENETIHALDLANKATDEQVQASIAYALRMANPLTPAAKDVLELGQQSPLESVRKAVERRLERLEWLERLK